MKIKTSELIGASLDWAVAHVIAKEERQLSALRIVTSGVRPIIRLLKDGGNPLGEGRATDFSTNWAAGGPIIERELLQVTPRFHSAGYTYPKGQWYWAAYVLGPNNMDENYEQHGPTPLIAAMRCFVASRLGDEVDIPEELL